MKVWYGYGSEHSMNLVMIGSFKEVRDATNTKLVLDRLVAQEHTDIDTGLAAFGEPSDRFTDGMRALLLETELLHIGPDEVQQFAYDVSIKAHDTRITITTDEADVSAFLKVLVSEGAKVEVYSAHAYPTTDASTA